MTPDFLILGGGIAGLTAAYELLKSGRQVTIIEKAAEVGGLARTFARDGFRFDLGGHRFHSNNPTVVSWLCELLGDDLLTVPRQSHIYLNGRFVNYPIQFPDAFTVFTLRQTALMLGSYLAAHLAGRRRPDSSFEDWVVRRFGRLMYRHFFQPYTEKVWGIPGSQLSAEWAAQRIGLPSLWQALRHTLWPPTVTPATAVSHFYYPRAGFGAIPQALRRRILALGGVIHTATRPLSLEPGPVTFKLVAQAEDGRHTFFAPELIATIPLDQLLRLLPATAERERLLARATLRYRGLICLFLALDRAQVSADSWTYFPDPAFIFGRTHEPKNWSAAMVPDTAVTSLAVEIFANPTDDIWSWPEDALAACVTPQFERLGWFNRRQVARVWSVRLPHAYPVYQVGYQERLAAVQAYLGRWPRLHLVGRTGSFRYLNSDGVIEDVFRFIAGRFPAAATAVQPLRQVDGRWV
jgi:protoporphyrinogen oxidase